MKAMTEIAEKNVRLAVGLMSGTSADGVDAALVRIKGAGPRSRIEVVGWETTPYPPGLRAQVLAVSSGETIEIGRVADLSFTLGHAFAEAAVEN